MPKTPSLFQAFLPLILLLSMIGINLYLFGDEILSGFNQLALLLATGITAIMGLRWGHSWRHILSKIYHNLKFTSSSILLLFCIGALSGTWLFSGIIPSMVYYGLQLIAPEYFLITCVLICSIVSIGTGSSWSTIATIGIAFLAMGQSLGFNPGLVAGAIISGAYFGDKLSPMSDTTNLAAAVTHTKLFTHIRYMLYTTVPSMLLSLGLFYIMGKGQAQSIQSQEITELLQAIQALFVIDPILFSVPLLVFVLIGFKISPLHTMLAGILAAFILGCFTQTAMLEALQGGTQTWASILLSFWKSAVTGFELASTNPMLTDLLHTGGAWGMLQTVWLIIAAMSFSGAMSAANMLERIAAWVSQLAQKPASLVGATSCSGIVLNTLTSDQYLSIVVSGQMFNKPFAQQKLKPEVLSRTIEDSSTVTSVLIPWNTCGAAQSSVLGISTLAYAPYCFFCILSPLITYLTALLNLNIRKLNTSK